MLIKLEFVKNKIKVQIMLRKNNKNKIEIKN